MESSTENAPGTWSVPQCPIAIAYSARVLDDIRLAVVDAFFSLPRGGAEIGGVLLGKKEKGRITILEQVPLECEHGLGPSFTLSVADHARLAELVADAENHPSGLRPLGWYHSHTRSEIFLSDADLDIHRRYFPEPWQVALVMKPHTFQPMRCGFFFREAEGAIHAESSYLEFELEPMPMSTVPSSAPLLPRPVPVPVPAARLIAAPAEPEPVDVLPLAPAEPAAEPGEQAPPGPEQMQLEYDHQPEAAPEPARRGMRMVLVGALMLALAAGALQTRQRWLPGFRAAFGPLLPAAPLPSLGLNTIDSDGQLQVRWDRSAQPVVRGIGARLEIHDAAPIPTEVQLDPPQLQAGTFTYARQSEHVDVILTIDEPDGQQVREVSSFMGRLPNRKPQPTADQAVRRQLDEQAERTRKLEKSLDELRRQLREQQRKRLRNQSR